MRCPSKTCRSRHWNHEYRRPNELDRFMSFVQVAPSGCWLWQGNVNWSGYGLFRTDGPMVVAHRFSYKQFVGPIAVGEHVHHQCHVKSCVNPLHLTALRADHHKDQHPRSLKAICKRGHELSGDNLYTDAGGRRWCRACNRIRSMESYWRIKQLTAWQGKEVKE